MKYIILFSVYFLLVANCVQPAMKSTPTPSPTPTINPENLIPFENIIKEHWPTGFSQQLFPDKSLEEIGKMAKAIKVYSSREAKLYVLSNKEDPLLKNNQWVSLLANMKIRDINFNEYIVNIAFQGERHAGASGINITDIWQNDGIINIRATFTEQGPGLALQEVSSVE